MDARERYIVEGRETVPGFFPELDALMFAAIDDSQARAGIEGDILEIGVFRGRSAVLLGYLQRPGERFVVCDVFNLSDQADFERHYRRFHPRLPNDIVTAESSALHKLGLGRTFRFIHIDGGHEYQTVRSDLALARDLLVDGGVVIFDDVSNYCFPGVAAAVWEGVANGGLIPHVMTAKLYASWTPGLLSDIEVPEGQSEVFPGIRAELLWERDTVQDRQFLHLKWSTPLPGDARKSFDFVGRAKRVLRQRRNRNRGSAG